MVARWRLAEDLLLLREMPVNFPKNQADWQLVAERISSAEFQVTGRGAKERWQKTLLIKFHADNTTALKRSGRALLGTEEQHTELDSLLQDLTDQQSDVDIESDNATAMERKKREEGLRIRNQALLTLKEKQTTVGNPAVSANASPSTSTREILVTPMPPPAKRSRIELGTISKSASTRNELLGYMKVRDERNAALQEKELENERQRIEIMGRQADSQLKMLEAIVNRYKEDN